MASNLATRRLAHLVRVTRTLTATRTLSRLSQKWTTPTCQFRVPAIQMPAATFHTTSARLNDNIVNIQDEDDFKKTVLENTKPVIVDFHAAWCGPCKLLGPSLETLVAAQKGAVLLAKVDIDELGDIAIDHDVEAVPTVLAMKGGKVVDKFIGLKDEAELESFIKKLAG